MRAHWEIIGQALREARDEIEGSQREVAEWLDIQPLSKYCDCEDGKADPHEVLRQLMSALVGRNKWAALCGQLKQERDEAKDALAAAKDKIKELEGQVSYARHERNKALNEIDEYKATFDVRWQAQMRAVTRWQEETGKEIFWPGHEDLCLWLIRKLEAAK